MENILLETAFYWAAFRYGVPNIGRTSTSFIAEDRKKSAEYLSW